MEDGINLITVKKKIMEKIWINLTEKRRTKITTEETGKK